MRVAITGHRPDAFVQSRYSKDMVLRIADNIVGSFLREYSDDLVFNLGGAIGVDQWAGMACIDNMVKFHLYLPFLPEIQSKYWLEEQADELGRQMQKAEGVTIVDPSGNYDVSRYHERDRKMVDDSDIVVAFWVGKRRGGTFYTMKYGLSQSKFVLNALDELRPVFKENLQAGWTPPTMRSEEL